MPREDEFEEAEKLLMQKQKEIKLGGDLLSQAALKLGIGNPYEQLGNDLGKLVAEKQKAYGDSFGKAGEVLKLLYPEGVKPHQYRDMLCVVRILDKLFRIANDKDAFGESPYRDIVGYGLLGAIADQDK